MSNKAKSIYFAVFAVLYFLFTVFVVKHGIHFINSAITFSVIVLAIYYYLKDKKN